MWVEKINQLDRVKHDIAKTKIQCIPGKPLYYNPEN